MADSDFNLLSFLKASYPLVPITTVLKVMNKFENDQEKCKQALDLEAVKRSNALTSESLPTAPMSNNNNNNNDSIVSNNSMESPNEIKSVTARIKELQVSHEGNSQSRTGNTERHVSTIERAIGNASRPPEPAKRTFLGPSVSWTVQGPDRPSPTTRTSTSNVVTTPQSAPLDLSSFFSRSASDIPNINCRTSGLESGLTALNSLGSRPQQIPINSLSASSSPVEQRRPVKVINIPPGSSSGGSVSSAVSQTNPRHIHMNFGDSGGICTVSTPPTMQRYGSTPNVSQNYRSEIRTEAPTAKPVHSSSIVVNTSGHTNHLAPERKMNSSISLHDFGGSGRRTPNPSLSLNTEDILSKPGPNNSYSSGKLSKPVQATSPGIAHSKPVFVEIKTDRVLDTEAHGGHNGTNYSSGFYQGGTARPMGNPSFLPQQNMAFSAQSPRMFNTQFSPEFMNATGFPVVQPQNDYMFPHNFQRQRLPGFHSPPTNLRLSLPNVGFGPRFNLPISLMGYPQAPGHFPGQGPGHLSHLSPGHSPGMYLPRSPILGHRSPGSRSNSQDSDHSLGMDGDAWQTPYNAMGSHGSSLSSLSSDSSGRVEIGNSGTRRRSGSVQDDVEYVRALVQHQKRQMQKLLEEMNQHQSILNKLRSEVGIMERNMIETSIANRRFPSTEDISGLCEKNRQLQTDIQLYMNEIDMYKSGQTPVNKINPLDQQNFFENMPTGQHESIYSRIPESRKSPSPRPVPPRRPPPPIPVRQVSSDTGQTSGGAVSGGGGDIFRVLPVPPTQPSINSGDSEEGESWNCSACTFFNHPALKKCEMCDMPRFTSSQQASSLAAPVHTSHQSVSSLSPRLVPGPGLVGNMHPRSGSPHPAPGHHHHHHTGT